jgi:hypothetical protein
VESGFLPTGKRTWTWMMTMTMDVVLFHR